MTRKDEVYMRWCHDGARLFSTCARRQYMALILDDLGHILGTGYNGGPRGMPHCLNGACPRAQSDVPPRSVYDTCIAIHAEANALLHSDYTARRTGGCTLYVNGTPCFGCAKLIANGNIRRVVTFNEGIDELWTDVRAFLRSARIQVQEFWGNTNDQGYPVLLLP